MDDDSSPRSLIQPVPAVSAGAESQPVPTAALPVEQETIVKEELPEVSRVMSPSVTEILEKMTNLEDKVDAMDALVESISSKAQLIEQAPPQPSPEPNQVQAQVDPVQDWVPTTEEIEEFLSTELGKGTLIFLTISSVDTSSLLSK